MNGFTVLFLVVVAAGAAAQWLLVRRHVRHIHAHRDSVPQAFRAYIPEESHRRSADYTTAKTRTGLVEHLVETAVLLVWTLGGALALLDQLWRSWQLAGLWTGTGFIASVIVIGAIVDLPMSLYRTFGLEQRYGFNKMTPALFVTDRLKQALLFLVIGLPMIVLVLWIMDIAGPLWWLWVWLTWLAFSLVMMWAWPAFIAPWFNKFRPLEDRSLRQRIEDLLGRNGFTCSGVFVMDGSLRSTRGNAYFTGLGSHKRIVFFDTLMQQLDAGEIEAVLAHELGHFKCRHIARRIAIMAAVALAGLAILGWLIDRPWFYHGLGATTPSDYMGLTLFALVAPAFLFFVQPFFCYLSRRDEFEADDFAARQARPQDLIQALVKLYRENANTLTPDPLYSAFHDSHPPAPIRVAHLANR